MTLMNDKKPKGYPFKRRFTLKDNKIMTMKFRKGKFDNYMFELTPFTTSKNPKDKEYFKVLQRANFKFEDIIKISDAMTGKFTEVKVENNILRLIDTIVLEYPEDCYDKLKKALWSVYYGFVAEELNPHTRIGRLIKLIGLYQVLVEKMDPTKASLFSYKEQWIERPTEWESKITGQIEPNENGAFWKVLKKLAEERGLDKWRK